MKANHFAGQHCIAEICRITDIDFGKGKVITVKFSTDI